jgi:hypothetical protein
MKKLHCLSASVITALLMAISVFLGNVSHTEYKSQMRKRKARVDNLSATEITAKSLDNTMTDTNV